MRHILDNVLELADVPWRFRWLTESEQLCRLNASFFSGNVRSLVDEGLADHLGVNKAVLVNCLIVRGWAVRYYRHLAITSGCWAGHSGAHGIFCGGAEYSLEVVE